MGRGTALRATGDLDRCKHSPALERLLTRHRRLLLVSQSHLFNRNLDIFAFKQQSRHAVKRDGDCELRLLLGRLRGQNETVR